ncbi:piggyBac transposable element-derived protein 4-like [Centruroides vittatus]|uniref:piggyBac transposable element-derived protein 4-like n=1 Tax=Centruroides vittatus TaxID=120091 RepID=UPI0035108754
MSESEISDSEMENFDRMIYDSEDDVDSSSFSSSTAYSDDDDGMEDQNYREVFSPEEPQPFPFTFQELPGPKHMPPPDSPPIAYFYLFFTNTLLSLMVEETNRYAQQVINGLGNNVPSYLKDWTEVSVPEMKGFLACTMNMGYIEQSDIPLYRFTSPIESTWWFREMFSKRRFFLILRFFHLVDKTKLPGHDYDPCAKLQLLLDHANKVFRHHYTPHQEISVDEISIGIKFWMMIDSVSNYCLGFERARSQQEEEDSISEFGVGYTVVRKLLEIGMYLNKGYHFFIERRFMSVPLVRHLYSLQTYVTGIVRRNIKMLPQQFKEKFAVGKISYFRSGPVLACAFREKKSKKNPVLLLSTRAWARDVEVIRNGKAELKPEIIQIYNKFISGIDTSDMVLYTYWDKNRPMQYWKNLAFNIIARMVLNSYILYKENFAGPGKPKSLYDYHVAVIKSLGEEWKATNRLETNPNNQRVSGNFREGKSFAVCTAVVAGGGHNVSTLSNIVLTVILLLIFFLFGKFCYIKV